MRRLCDLSDILPIALNRTFSHGKESPRGKSSYTARHAQKLMAGPVAFLLNRLTDGPATVERLSIIDC